MSTTSIGPAAQTRGPQSSVESPPQTVVSGGGGRRTTRTTTTTATEPQVQNPVAQDALDDEVGIFDDVENFIKEVESGEKLSEQSIIGVVVVSFIILMFIISIIIAGVYTSRFNESLSDGELPHGEVLKSTSDLMAVSWLFVGVPIVNVGLASGFASMYDTTKRRMRRAAARTSAGV